MTSSSSCLFPSLGGGKGGHHINEIFCTCDHSATAQVATFLLQIMVLAEKRHGRNADEWWCTTARQWKQRVRGGRQAKEAMDRKETGGVNPIQTH